MQKISKALCFLSIAAFVFTCPLRAQQLESVTAERDTLLARYEPSGREFMRLEIEDIISYFHQRRIGEAIVELDFIRYQFDRGTRELIDRTVRWRERLPERVEPVVTREEAESMARGNVRYAKLYFISPESDVFPLDPPPSNPCWVVRSETGDGLEIVIIDAMTGDRLGYGVPPPSSTGYSLSGPGAFDIYACECPWTRHYQNAAYWFEMMGYPTAAVEYPSTEQIGNGLQNDETSLFYLLAHGTEYSFRNGCPGETDVGDVYQWLYFHASVPFAFIGTCYGMCTVDYGSFSDQFRKKRYFDAATVGYCGMDTPECDQAWAFSVKWQDLMFERMSEGQTVYDAFLQAIAGYPECLDCMRFAGDELLKVVPMVTRSLCGPVYDGNGGPLEYNTRSYYVRCDVSVPPNETLLVSPSVVVAVMLGSRITAEGTLSADGTAGEVRFIDDDTWNHGIRLNGQLRMMNGGCIKIHD